MSSGGVECVTHRAGAGMSEGKALGRTQLKGLLDNLVQKSLEEREDNVDADVEEAARDLLELTDESGRGKKRRHSKVSGVKRKKKRMRKDVGSRRKLCQESLDVPNGTRHTPHVMTLFDRKVDLAKFSPDTPLYVMCREWMSNNPDSSHAPQPTASQGHTLTSQILPLPTPLPMDRDGHEIRIDIPKPHPPLAKNRHEMETDCRGHV